MNIKTILTDSLAKHNLSEISIDKISLFEILFQSLSHINKLEQEIKILKSPPGSRTNVS